MEGEEIQKIMIKKTCGRRAKLSGCIVTFRFFFVNCSFFNKDTHESDFATAAVGSCCGNAEIFTVISDLVLKILIIRDVDNINLFHANVPFLRPEIVTKPEAFGCFERL